MQTRSCSKKKTLVLDLDETLVHSTLGGLETNLDFRFGVVWNGRVHQVNVSPSVVPTFHFQWSMFSAILPQALCVSTNPRWGIACSIEIVEQYVSVCSG